MRRTADALRAGDIVELFPGTPLLVLSVHPDPEAPGCWKVIVLGAEKEWAIQSVPPETWYVVLSRGPLGRASDRITQLLRLAGRK